MINDDEKIKFFKKSKIFILNKLENNISVDELTKIKFTNDLTNFHPDRKTEFLLGRYAASLSYKALGFNSELILNSNEDRSPSWPSGVKGSISHSDNYIGAALSCDPSLLGIGIDFEIFGRVKSEMKRFIQSEEDLKSDDNFSELELLTFIFSAKEALYKAIYPEVKKYFGFKAAALYEINNNNNTFKIKLTENLNSSFGPSCQYEFFNGKFKIHKENIITIIEIDI